jgi:hypothetical protein
MPGRRSDGAWGGNALEDLRQNHRRRRRKMQMKRKPAKADLEAQRFGYLNAFHHEHTERLKAQLARQPKATLEDVWVANF